MWNTMLDVWKKCLVYNIYSAFAYITIVIAFEYFQAIFVGLEIATQNCSWLKIDLDRTI